MSKYINNLFTAKVVLDSNGKRIYPALLDPIINTTETDIYVLTVSGDRLDLLAWKYYRNESYWWIIQSANPDLRKDSLVLPSGLQLRIPRDPDTCIQQLQLQNNSR